MKLRSRGRQAEVAWHAGCDDARRLAVELAAGRPYWPIDVMQLGLVIEPDETAFRYVAAALSQFDSQFGCWPAPMQVGILITDQRIVVRMPHGAAISLWWNGILAIEADLAGAGTVVLDYGDNEPRAFGGAAVWDVGVAAVAGAYGIAGMLRHPALDCLRWVQPSEAAWP